MGAAGPRLAFAWQAQYRELPGCLSRGRRSAQSLLAELRRAWAPLARGCLICVAGAVHRASWRSCSARGRRWPAAALYAWQAQYTEPPGGAAARVGAAGPRLPFASQAQYTEPPGGAAARVGGAGPRLQLRGRRSTETTK